MKTAIRIAAMIVFIAGGLLITLPQPRDAPKLGTALGLVLVACAGRLDGEADRID